MNKLLTLKDLDESCGVKGMLYADDARSAAIDHIRAIKKVIKEKEGQWDYEGIIDLGMRYEEQGGAIIAWIKYFFDVTDVDLNATENTEG